MKRCLFMATICLMLAGCYSEITTTPMLGNLTNKVICIREIQCSEPSVAASLRNSIYQELLKAGIEITADEKNATIVIMGSAVVGPVKAEMSEGLFTDSIKTSRLVETVSLRATTVQGGLLFVANFNNWSDLNVSDVGKFFGQSIAGKLRGR